MRQQNISEIMSSAVGGDDPSSPDIMFYKSPIGSELQDSLAKARGKTALFLGSRSNGANIDALGQAQAAHEAGVPREKIWADTGWFMGPDSRWRYEISDDKTSFEPRQMIQDYATNKPPPGYKLTYPLNEVLDHPDLMSSYKKMSSLPVYSYEAPVQEGIGISTQNDLIGLNMRPYPNESYPDMVQRQKSTLLHELQHSIQREEGFNGGGDPGDKTLQDMGNLAPFETYRRLGGEVEARTTQKRMNLTPEQRRARPPWLDYDVPEDQQIIRKTEGNRGY